MKSLLLQTNTWTLVIVFFALPLLTSAQQLQKEYQKTLQESSQGEIVKIPGFITQDFPLIPYKKIVMPGPQYLISDDPEYIRVSEAVAMKEKVRPGSVRLYIYNVNGWKETKKGRKITAVITNTGEETMNMRLLKYSSQKPSTNYYKIGKEGLADFFASDESTTITIKPGETIPIDQKLEENVVKYNELVHGFYEFVVDQPGEVSVIQTDPSTPGPEALKNISKVLKPKGHSGAGRGVFGVSNYKIKNTAVIDTQDGAVQLLLADGEIDPWVEGIEGTTGREAKLAGNYGVMYDIELKWRSTNGKGLALVTWNSRSEDNRWCGGMALSMMVSKGKFDAGITQIPQEELVTRKAPDAVVIQVFTPTEDRGEQTIKLTYSPPGASCLPTPLVFIPIEIDEIK